MDKGGGGHIHIHQGLEVIKLVIYTRIWLRLWSNKIDKIIKKFGLRRNNKHFTKLKITWLRQGRGNILIDIDKSCPHYGPPIGGISGT
jgi:hypothetical protein